MGVVIFFNSLNTFFRSYNRCLNNGWEACCHLCASVPRYACVDQVDEPAPLMWRRRCRQCKAFVEECRREPWLWVEFVLRQWYRSEISSHQFHYRPGQAHRVPEVWVRVPDFKTISTRRWQGCQPYPPAAFSPQEIFLVLISVRGWVNPRAIVRSELDYGLNRPASVHWWSQHEYAGNSLL
jgi:hypothetical protein